MDADQTTPLPSRVRPSRAFRQRGFTLVEMLAATTLLVVMITLVLQITTHTSRAWRDSVARIKTFQEARAGFDSMTRALGQATLNTYYDYYQGSAPRSAVPAASLGDFEPDSYDRISDLHFVCGQSGTLLAGSPSELTTQTHAVFFQAPAGYSIAYRELDNSLNALGYYLAYSDEAAAVPAHIRNAPGYQPRYRFRLMEMRQPTENLPIFAGGGSADAWFAESAATHSRVAAENVLALVILPRLPDTEDSPERPGGGVALAPNFNYNSRIPLGATADPTWPGANPPFPPNAFTAFPASGGSVPGTRHHQLPPLLRVMMLVVDEQSFQRLQKSAGGDPATPPAAVDLAATTLFTDALRYEADLDALKAICEARPGNVTGNTVPLNYQLFFTDITLKEAKWSNQ